MGRGCDLPFAMTYIKFTCVFWQLASARRVTVYFGGRFWKVRPAFRKAGRTFLWVASFPTRLGWSGRDLDANRSDSEEVRPALRKAGCTLGVGLGGSKTCWKMEVLRMTSSIVENVPTPRETIFKLSPASQLPYRAKIQKLTDKYTNTISLVFSISDHVAAIVY